MRPLALLLLAGLGAHAWAFAPAGDTDVYQGVEPSRIHRVHPERQRALAHATPWQSFLATEGAGWMARFDEATGLPARAWGPGLDLGPLAGPDDAVNAVLALVERHPELFGVSAAELVPREPAYVARTGIWYVQLDQVVQGVPVWRGGVTARFKHGRLALFGANTWPQASGVNPTPTLSPETAVEQAIELGPEPFAAHQTPSARRVILPLEGPEGRSLHLAWEVHTRTADPPGLWVSHIDAHTGALLNVYNAVRFLSGEVWATHDLRTVDGNTTTSPLPLANLSNGAGASTVTGAAGEFILEESGGFSVSLSGDYVRVYDSDNRIASVEFTGSTYTLTTADATQAEIDSYVFLHHVYDWAQLYAPEVSWGSERITSYVNLNSSCNAYFDGNVNFYREGSGCNNTARIADVNYHEWGHGFHYYSLESGAYDGTIGEGYADVVAFLQTGDNVIAPYFGTDGSGIRDVAPDRVYPDDVVNQTHTDGLIFAGAVWDLLQALIAEKGEAEAFRIVSQLSVEAIKGGPTLTETYDEYALADDDDGDLTNGSPNQCALLEAFGAHGLGPGGSSDALASLGHDTLGNQLPTAAEYPVSAELVNLAPACVEVNLDQARVWFSTDGGTTWDSAALDTDGDNTVQGAIPQQPAGSVVHYYIELSTADGASVSSPAGGVINPHSFAVGELVELYCADFEDDDGGYTHELIDGPDQEGADDWDHGRPTGLADDPDEAFSGRNVWGNDLGGGRYNGEYQPGVHNRLSSPAIDISGDHAALILQFRRWLNVEDGHYDEARVLVDGEVAWSNYATSRAEGDAHHKDTEWALHTVRLTDPDGDGLVTLSWEIESDEGMELGGWNLDDVCIYALTTVEDPGEDPGEDSGQDDSGDGEEDPTGDDTGVDESLEIKPTTCGCTTPTAPAAPPAAWLGLAALVGLRRRR